MPVSSSPRLALVLVFYSFRFELLYSLCIRHRYCDRDHRRRSLPVAMSDGMGYPKEDLVVSVAGITVGAIHYPLRLVSKIDFNVGSL